MKKELNSFLESQKREYKRRKEQLKEVRFFTFFVFPASLFLYVLVAIIHRSEQNLQFCLMIQSLSPP